MFSSTQKVIATLATLFLLTALSVTNYGIFSTGVSVLQWLIFFLVTGFFAYPLLQNLLGLSITRDGWKLNVSLSQSSSLGWFGIFVQLLLQVATAGFKDFTSFRTGLDKLEEPMLRRELLSVLAAFTICFHFGLLNLIFPIAFWYVCLKQVDLDRAAGTHLLASEILLGVTIFILSFIAPTWVTFIIYPIFTIIWGALYFRGDDARIDLAMLQLAKLLIFASSKFLPYLVLRTFSVWL